MNDQYNDLNPYEGSSTNTTEPFVVQENTSEQFVPPVVSFDMPNNPMNTNVEVLDNTTTMAPVVPSTAPIVAPSTEAMAPIMPSTTPMVNSRPIEALSTEPITSPSPMINPVLPNSNVINMEQMDSNIRYNPVTGEEVNIQDIMNPKKEEEEVVVDKKQRRKEIKQKVRSTWNSILLLILFFFLIVFVVFLPEVQTTVSNFLNGKQETKVENITSGSLVCTLSTSTTNLDRDIERIFQFENNKLKKGKFTTIVRGDITLDESALDQLYEQCSKVKEAVSNYDGVDISCNYDAGKLEEKETFDYQAYSVEEVSNAYFEAGSSLLELTYDEDIDKIMVQMRQGGFTCNKERR